MATDPYTAKPIDLTTGVSTPDAPGVNPSLAGPTAPSSQPSGSLSKFKKGLLIFLVLAIPLSVFVAANYKTVFKQKAAGCVGGTDYFFSVDPQPAGHNDNVPNTAPKAYETVHATNNCDTDVTAYLFKFWCSDINKTKDPNYWGFCYDNGAPTQVTVPAHTASQQIYVEQAIGGTGTCGSAQVDIQFGGTGVVDDASLIYGKTIFGVAAYGANVCTQVQPLSCDGISNAGSGTIANGSETRALTASASGGTAPYTFTWTKSVNTGTDGTLSSATGQTTTWTAPGSLGANQTWTVSLGVTDAANVTAPANAACTITLTHTSGPQNYTYKTCENNACVTKDCNPKTTDCSAQSSCTQNSNCTAAQTYTYKTCENNACVTKDCDPKTTDCSASKTTCTQNSNCTTTTTHKTCQNNACVSVSGSGSDSCSSDAMCAPTATPPSIPSSGTTDLTVFGIGAGAVVAIFGAILAL